MNISVRWLNNYLSPAGLSAEDAENTLMSVGFPSESRTELSDGDARLDLEVTSNRGDVLCHHGAARELAAKTGRTLLQPAFKACPADDSDAKSLLRLDNQTPDVCPLFTARIIRGVKVGPSPDWLRAALEAVGQRSISNIVDITNFITLELGNPCHVFDLARLEGAALVIRYARDKESLTTLDGKKRSLAADELVVADARRAQSLAGVIGGADSEVSATTTDVVLEMATWDPVTVRRASRRHAVRTDASHRFERIVDARTIHDAAERAASLIAELGGGRLCRGALSSGKPLPSPTTIRLRPERCRDLLGVEVSPQEIITVLRSLGLEVGPLGRGGDDLLCTVPAWRPDLTREVDLIEEVLRVRGLDAIHVAPTLAIAAGSPQTTETARRELCALLTGLGFFETVTFSFTSRAAATAFLPTGMSAVEVNDDRRKAEPVCRPSALPGLLACRRANQHAHVKPDGGVRLFEISAVFAQGSPGESFENLNLALLADAPIKGKTPKTEELQQGVRELRGVIEALVRTVAGPAARLDISPAAPHCPGLDPAAYATISLDGKPLGYFGLIAREQLAAHDLAEPLVAAELNLPRLLAAYPPKTNITLPPSFPGIERDVSFVLPESTQWDTLAAEVRRHAAPPMEHASFVASFRGAQIGKGRKSVTVRLHFRDPARTLRHEEIDAPVAALVERVKTALGAEVRG